MEALLYTHYALIKGREKGVNSPEETCNHFLELFNDLYAQSIHKGIMSVKIASSKDIGQIAFELQKKGIVKIPSKYKIEDFDDLFEQVS